jgi:outer membrane scaffolding protein for murein synthesis (MipA/OmpV family)
MTSLLNNEVSMKFLLSIVSLTALSGISPFASALDESNSADPKISEWQVGAGVGSGSVNDSSFGTKADVILDVQYFGDKVTFRDGALFISGQPLLGETRLPDEPAVQFSLQLQPRVDPRQGSDDDLKGLRERDTALEAGVNFRASYAKGYFEGRVLKDISNTHKGLEVGLRYVHRLAGKNWTAKPWLGGSYHDNNLLDYYFGVTTKDTCAVCSPYTVDESAFAFGAGFELDYQIRDRWIFSVKTSLHSFDNQVTDSATFLNGSLSVTGAASVRYRF